MNSNALSAIHDFNVIPTPELSDHAICSLCLEFKHSHTVPYVPRNAKCSITTVRPNLENLIAYNNILQSSPFVSHNETVEERYNYFLKEIQNSARTAGLVKTVVVGNNKFKKPWFDVTCNAAKKIVNQRYRIAKKNKFGKMFLDTYVTAKKNYLKILKEKKRP